MMARTRFSLLLHRPGLPPMPTETKVLATVAFSTLAALMVWYSAEKTGHTDKLDMHDNRAIKVVSADLSGDKLGRRPADWVSRDVAKKHYFAKWCARPDTECPEDANEATDMMSDSSFLREFWQVRSSYIDNLPSPKLNGRDLRNADLSNAFLPGVVLHGADLKNASLKNSKLESATISQSDITGASFEDADMQHAKILESDATSVNFVRTDLKHATLEGRFVGIFKTDGRFDITAANAVLAKARFRNSLIVGDDDVLRADMIPMQTDDPDRASTFTEHANFHSFEGANFMGIQTLDGQSATSARSVENGFSILPNGYSGVAFKSISLRHSYIPRDVQPDSRPEFWERTLKNSFGGPDVLLPKYAPRPCQWLPDRNAKGDRVAYFHEHFFGAWRAWLERGGQKWPPFNGLDRIDHGFGYITDDYLGIAHSIAGVASMPELLPPESMCNWQSCDCAEVRQWRKQQTDQ